MEYLELILVFYKTNCLIIIDLIGSVRYNGFYYRRDGYQFNIDGKIQIIHSDWLCWVL